MRSVRAVSTEPFGLRRVGVIESPLDDLDAAPKQGREGGAEAWIVLAPELIACSS